MSNEEAQVKIDAAAGNYAELLRDGHWTLEHAHWVLKNDNLDLFDTAGLAKAIACFQCSQW